MWPDNYDRACFPAVDGHEFVFTDNGPGHWAPDPSFEPVAYFSECLATARRHRVEAVVSTHDLGDLVAAAIARELGLVGPDPDAVFLCLHKYYSRQTEADPIGCTPVPLAGDPPTLRYPVFVKAPWLKLGLLGFKAEDEHDLEAAMCIARREYPRWSRQYYPLFELAVDTSRFPLATTDMLLAEEFVDAPQVTVEGWVQGGRPHIWAITDTNTYPGSRVIDGFSTPSRHTLSVQYEIAAFAVHTVTCFGLDDTFFNLELWLTDGGIRLTEVNGRAAVCFAGIYRPTLGTSVFRAVADVACGHSPSALPRPLGRLAAQFNLITHGSGLAGDLVDFEAASRFPRLRLFRRADEHVEPVSEFGVVLGQMELVGNRYDEIRPEAEYIRRRVLRRPESSPWTEVPASTAVPADLVS